MQAHEPIKIAFDQIYRLDAQISAVLPGSAGVQTKASAVVIQDLHVNRKLYPPASYALGSLYWETDRTVWYLNAVVKAANTWIYVDGTDHGTLSNIPTDLGANDSNFQYEVTDYAHILKWNGSGWAFLGNDASNYFIDGTGTAPSPVGWHACDGSTVTYLKSDGTTGTTTVPNTNSTAAYVKSSGSYSNTITSANAPGLTGHTASNTTGISVSVGSTASTSGGDTAGAAGPASVTDPGHTHNVGTLAVDTTGEPAHVIYVRWFRI